LKTTKKKLEVLRGKETITYGGTQVFLTLKKGKPGGGNGKGERNPYGGTFPY